MGNLQVYVLCLLNVNFGVLRRDQVSGKMGADLKKELSINSSNKGAKTADLAKEDAVITSYDKVCKMGVFAKEKLVTTTNSKAFQDGAKMEVDVESECSDDEMLDCMDVITELGESYLTDFCKKASTAFFKQHGLLSHQINSYNDFISYGIKNVLDLIGEIKVDSGYDPSKKGDGDFRYGLVRFGEVSIERPKFWSGTVMEGGEVCLDMYPRHARLQNMTYSARIFVKTYFEVYTQKKKDGDTSKEVVSEEDKEVFIGRVPVMVKSDLCWMKDSAKCDCDFDEGGYFIVKGAEKVFIAQEQPCLKRLWISNDPYWRIAYRPPIMRQKVITKLVDSPRVGNSKGGDKVLRVYCLLVEVPIWVLFFALGVSSDKEIVDLIECGTSDGQTNNIIMASIRDADEECDGFRHRGCAVNYMDKLMKARNYPSQPAEELIKTTLFPNLPGLKQKARFFGYMVKCLLQAISGRRKIENRDDFRNKRVHLASELLEHELYVHVKHAVRRMVKSMQRDMYGDRSIDSVSDYFEASVVTNGLSRAFSTGAWAHPFKRSERISGVVANLRRTNPLQAFSDMRKTRQQVNYTGRVGEARYPHPSHWGRLCFLTTPDGENCGLVKNLAVTGIVTNVLSEPIVEKLFSYGMEGLVDDTCTPLAAKDKVLLDGEWVGLCSDSLAFVKELRKRRREQQLSSQVEIKRDIRNREVRIFCDAGRILRPLLIVENLSNIKSLEGCDYSFQSLLEKGIIEMVGIEEEEDCHTAWSIKHLFTGVKGELPTKYTHCELDPSFLLSLGCGIIPFANHDHARRSLYQSAKHSGQAIGHSTTNPNIRLDTLSHQLFYPQKPLFQTVLSDCLGKPEYFNGQNCIVAVNTHFGYNQEDSLVMNRASMERGMFRSQHVRSYKAEVENKETTRKRRAPDEMFKKIESKTGRADCLEDDGFPYVGASLESRDIIIGRGTEAGLDHSLKLKHTEKGVVQKVVLSSNNDGKNFATVSLRQVRSPCLGDKFSSMHGQKGVLGFLEAQENLPFTIQGIVPDVVINPHAFPSRQTPGQLLEGALGKVISLSRDGSSKYATPFSTLTVETIAEQLHKAGFSRWGNERVYNGRTGEKVQSMIFMGPTFYQRLVHMAEDKVKFRNTGPVHPLTRQPVADRKRFGGVKFGEMERDCMIAHGASTNLHERLFTLSDATQMHVCRRCTNVANVVQRLVGPAARQKVRGPYCRFCDSAEEIVKVSMPYGAKLLCQELFSMGISLKFETKLS
ncbi:hypothetical protein V2J09_003358 [Rumex salicifolius]